jgi:hypothetical protein
MQEKRCSSHQGSKESRESGVVEWTKGNRRVAGQCVREAEESVVTVGERERERERESGTLYYKYSTGMPTNYVSNPIHCA